MGPAAWLSYVALRSPEPARLTHSWKAARTLAAWKTGIEEAAPDFGGGEAAGCEARDDTKVVRAAFGGAPEIRVG